MRLPALARSAALSLRPGPNPLAFPGLVVAAARDVGPVDDARVEVFDGACRRWPAALRRVGPERRRCRRGPADDIDRGASVGFETESKYRLRLVGYPSVLGAHSQVDWNGKRYGIHGEPRIFKRLPSEGLRRLRDRP
jgi:hypothetical protein